MPARSAFDWTVMRIVPRVERGEAINVGVILYCGSARFLGARIALDRARLLALDPTIDVEEVERALAVITPICAGDSEGGLVARMPPAERFQWLAAPRSTITQPGPIHTGICDDPQAMLDDIFAKMVLPIRR